VKATLTTGGPGAAAVQVLNSPQNLGRIPGGQITAASFALRINPAALAAITIPNRLVDLTVTLESSNGDIQLPRQTFTFRHALNSDDERFHYSTDFPAGGREIRDLNRNLQIDKPDIIDPFTGIQLPDEDITFSTMFIAGTAGGLVTNTLGEDLDNSGRVCGHNFGLACTTDPDCASTCVANVCTNSNPAVPCATSAQCVFTCLTFTPGERDILPNGLLDKGILASAGGPSGGDKVPFNFDANNGGFLGLRHPFSRTQGNPPLVAWEWKRFGLCGFQSALEDTNTQNGFQNNGAGIWHTGDGDQATPLVNANACDNHLVIGDAATPVGTEFVMDMLVSPIIAKVHQVADSRGLPYTVEFQRFGMNMNHQTLNESTGGNLNIDNNVEDDTGNCLLCQEFDPNYGGIDYQVANFRSGAGVSPANAGDILQRTFGPREDEDGSTSTGNPSANGDETGFSGFTQNNNPASFSPIPTALPDLLPYPLPTATAIGVCDGGTQNGRTCLPSSPATCVSGGGSCTAWTNNIQGPVRNFDMTLTTYEAGYMFMMSGPGASEVAAITPFDVNPGTRWQIGVGFYTIETAAGTGDYGFGLDDVVFEWDERHPIDESQFAPPHTAACSRFGQPGQPAGQQCATLMVDRTALFECDEGLVVTVNDPKVAGAGSVIVRAASDSDARLVSTGQATALHPLKSFTLPEVSPGLFTGSVAVTQTLNTPQALFVSPSGDTNIIFYYADTQCDGNRNATVAQNDFDNLDGDGVAIGPDNCDFAYNPTQTDSDGDGFGNACDNCPNQADATLKDSDGDGVGDLCDFDDVDFDGVVNDLDNCVDVYNPLQTPGAGATGRGAACDSNSTDRDGDGINDRTDSCVRTANPAPQLNADGDKLGDPCDGDCVNAVRVTLPIGSCSRTSTTQCTTNAQCPVTGFCSENVNTVCTSSTQQCTCVAIAPETCQKDSIANSGGCQVVDDDVDADGVPDSVDNCPVVANLPIIAGTFRQADADNDGLGDACDSALQIDGDNNGVPDDIVSFGLLVNCGKLDLPNLIVESAVVNDVNGDGDAFCDTGEKCEMTVVVANAGGIPLTGVTLHLATADTDIQCVTKPSLAIGPLPAGGKVDTSNIGGQRLFFEYTVSPTTQTTSASSPAKADWTLNVTAREAIGTASKVAFQTLLDLDLPVGAPLTRVAGPDGIFGNADDGLVFENFDIDRNGANGVEISDGREGVPNDTFGFTVGTAIGGINALEGIGCGGFRVPPQDPGCHVDPDNDMDWHIHCPVGSCPAPNVVGSTTAFSATPAGGSLAFSGSNSLHWGRHTSATSRDGDSTSFRALAAYVTTVNLTPLPISGDLRLSFYHIAVMMDNTQADIPNGQAVDRGDVQIRVDLNPNPVVDTWGFWDKLAPFENVYDHIPYIWSHYGAQTTYCDLTPTDTGSAPPAPRGVHETMCWPQGVWSHCGTAHGLDTTFGCPGPGEQGALAPSGGALWVRSRFSLANYVGARVQIRWIASSWEFDLNGPAEDYQTYGHGWENSLNDDGWWVDDISITGAITSQVSPEADAGAAPPATCPLPANQCNPALGADHGYNPALAVSDANGDGVYEKGENVELSAAGTTNPGGCANGVTEYRFLRGAQVAQDWSANAFFRDGIVADTTYKVLARCNSTPACLTTIGATQTLLVYPGDGTDLVLTLADLGGGNASLSITARPQPPTMSGFDFFRYLGPPAPPINLAGTVTLACDQGIGTPVGSPVTVPDGTFPGLNQVLFYWAGHSGTAPGAKAALGRRTDNGIRIAPVNCP
jgi:hypothetical protein